MRNHLLSTAAWLLLMAGGLMAAPEQTNTIGLSTNPVVSPAVNPVASPATSSNLPPTAVASFQIITQRNIFDPRRTRDRGNETYQRVRPPRIETFSFRGTALKIGKDYYDAFFDGDGAPRSGVLNVNDTINGYKIKAITNDSVTLATTKGTNQEVVVVKAEWGLTRTDGGEWKMAFNPAPHTTGARAQNSGDGANGGGQSAGVQNNSGDRNSGDNGGYGNGSYTSRRSTRYRGTDNSSGLTTSSVSSSPPAAVDPDVLKRLQARRAQEEK
jgi:hypothetical protein